MKLLHVFPTFEPGGTQLRIIAIMNALGSEFEHEIFAVDGNFAAANRIAPQVRFRLLNTLPGSGTLLYPLALRKVIQQSRPDLLLTYNWGAIDAVIGACLFPPCPIVHNECGFGDDESVHMKQRRVIARRLVLPRIHTTVVVSSVLLRIAREQFGLPPQKVKLIRTGVDLNRFAPHAVSDGPVRFGYVGGLREEKNVALLLRAFAEAAVANAELVLVGDGPDRAKLEALAAELGIAQRVSFVGRVDDVAPRLAAFDVFTLPSNTEQTSNALLEAMAAGLPVVCTDVGDNRELLSASQAQYVVTAGDVNGFAQALKQLAADAQLRTKLGAENRQRCESDYSFDRMVKEYRELYLAR
jgi:glycosyltransferase involved in cell wall biosynthesis